MPMNKNPFKAMSRSRSASGDRERQVPPPAEDTPPPGLPAPAPPPAPPRPAHTLHHTDGAQSLLLQAVAPAVKQPTGTTDSDLELVISDEVIDVYNDQTIQAPANVLIKNLTSGGLYSVQKGDKQNQPHGVGVEQHNLGARPKLYEQIDSPSATEVLEKKLSEITKRVSELSALANVTTGQLKEHHSEISKLQTDMDITDGNIDQITSDIKDNYKDIRSIIDSKRSSRSSTRASSRRSSRDNSPSDTEEVLKKTSSELQRHKKKLEQIERAKSDQTEAINGQRKLKKKFATVADIMEKKAIWSNLSELREDKIERYQSWLKTLIHDYQSFSLPEELLVPVALRKLPEVLRQTALDKTIETEADLRIFLHQNIFGGRSYEYQKSQFIESNRMSQNDTNYPEVLRAIQTEQVPVLMSLQPELLGANEETLATVRDREILSLFKDAIQPTVRAVAYQKGAAANYKDLFRSCNEAASAKLVLAKSGGRKEGDNKTIAGLQVEDITSPREEELKGKIKKLENIVSALKKKMNASPNSDSRNEGSENRRGMYCFYHKSRGHNSKDCLYLKHNKLPENTEKTDPPEKRYIVLEGGRRNYCGFCVPNQVKLQNQCQHCWRHSNPAVAVVRDECKACQYQKRVQGRDPAQTPPSQNDNKNDTN